ncbi:MAG TPA: DUF1573 domain-containing protein [Bacteroidales bacterium]|jgi:hypothetical protein|nr:DUF1573 domain-containing protein [Bacteroidales bacterium]NLH33765.1 DUF1573 domain-containing protein [Lentimicrobium sp.]MBP7874893.1 DUF1573 domain-containing protein [Bacteroidales bacterium]MCZ2282384.1 DUF1573 domain-containing protein [Bacteroidales bacterium]HNY59194.1 DUF1573 domain-containing protein [Bacteroidales bacterium]
MKKSIFLMMLTIMSVTIIFAQSPVKTTKSEESKTVSTDTEVEIGPKAEWAATTIDLGEVQFMVKKDASFTLTNTGNQPLLITSARASCGCTNLKYSQEPILPGKSTELSVTFNGSGNGAFRKSITVQTNASENPTILQITGKVVKNN